MDKDKTIGTAVGNIQNLLGAIALSVPRKARPPYLRARIEQAEKFLEEYRKDLK